MTVVLRVEVLAPSATMEAGEAPTVSAVAAPAVKLTVAEPCTVPELACTVASPAVVALVNTTVATPLALVVEVALAR